MKLSLLVVLYSIIIFSTDMVPVPSRPVTGYDLMLCQILFVICCAYSEPQLFNRAILLEVHCPTFSRKVV